jgi:hypothetical protein
MRIIVYFLFALIFVLNRANAQTNFAPLGATWYHSGYYGVYKSFVSKDTVFKGQACRKIEQDIYIKWGKFYPYLETTRDLYVYDNEDTVFCYNNRFDRFTPLFVFNLNAGDTLRLPYFNTYDCTKAMDTNGLAIAMIVDSVINVNYDGTMLKTIHAKQLKTTISSYGWSPYGDSIIIYAQKLGSLKTGFLPYCQGYCASLTVEGCATPRNLRCYEDDSTKIHLVDTCIDPTWVNAAIEEQQLLSAQIKPYPNPAYHSIVLSSKKFNFSTTVIVYDVFGHKMFEQDFAKQASLQLNVEHLASGMYFVKVYDQDTHSSVAATFIKQ